MANSLNTAITMPSRRERANALRALAMDAVQQANSGHPGMPMGMADIAEVLWNNFLQHNPGNPLWPNRDRFVLSNGHGSMLLYGVLHLTGYPLSMDEIRNFRQFGFRTAGHPEVEQDIGIETTTGPLGQGIANAVGMALAEKVLAAQFNRPDFPIVDHHTYVFLGDGCLMEGISHEACSLAGTLKLGKLICLYDDNGISIDGQVARWFTDDTPGRFRAYGWHVISDVDGHDPDAIQAAISAAREVSDQPSMICCKTIIGYGAPDKQGTEATHGAPLGVEEVKAAREELQWPHPPFSIPESIYAGWDARSAGRQREGQWNKLADEYAAEFPALAAELNRRVAGELPDDWSIYADAAIQSIDDAAESVATRKASLISLNAFAPKLPELIGGSADLTGSNLTKHSGSKPISAEQAAGNYIWFGVREFGMTALLNGISLHGGFIPYGGTFLVFSDYARNALRMAALMKIQNIMVFTHDSIGLGEDGPTHQPIEHLASLQLMPNMSVWRPCDAVETVVAWRHAIERRGGPTSLVLTRQSVPSQSRSSEQILQISRGGYVLQDAEGIPDVIMIASGSEVALAMQAAELVNVQNSSVRIVSMPNAGLFLEQDAEYRESVLPSSVTRRLAIEAGSPQLWYQFVGSAGRVIGMNSFGASAPAAELFKHFGFSPESVAQAALELVEKS
jgi:transketolase